MKIAEFYKNKRVFVTGHTGFKGSWLCEILLSFGANVAGYSLEPENRSLFNVLNLDRHVTNIIGDIRNLEFLKKNILDFSPDIIIHMAAQPLVIDSYERPVYTYETNVMGTVNILESLRYCKTVKSFLNVTTDKVYENKEWEWGYREYENLCGYDPYSNSKSCSELVTYSYKNSFFNNDDSPAISTARSGNVIGGGDFSANRIVPDCVKSSIEKKDILVRNPNSTRPYQHVLECLYGYLMLCMKQYNSKLDYEGNYNFGPDESNCITTGQLASLFCNIWGNGQKWITKSIQSVHEANFLKLDCSKSKNRLQWYPCLSIEESIKYTIDWYKSYEYDNTNIRKITKKQINDYFYKVEKEYVI